jgi:hypothetical protein
MKIVLSYILYIIGDIISRTIISYRFGFKLYNKIMLLSVDLDTEGRIWKFVKSKRRHKNGKSKRSGKSKIK